METWIIDGVIIVFAVWFLARRLLPAKGINNISTTELKGILRDKQKQFIDVRTPGEYRSNHIREFKNIPLNELRQRANEINPEKEVVVICQSGMRSQQASRLLKKMNYNQVTNVRGGMSAWS